MLNDQLIGAYLDGELDPEKRALVEYWLANDNGAAARVERMRGGDALLRRAIPKMGADSNDPLTALILARPTNVVNLFERVAQGQGVRRAVALAAACVLGVLAGRFSDSPAAPGFDPRMSLNAEIERVLETMPSGQNAPIMGGELQMAMSLQTESGAFCRQFRVTSGPDVADAVACREDGQWRLAVQAAAPAETESYVAAAATASPIEAAINAMGGANVLDHNEERALIASDWRARQ
jgi:hypothetical protein